MITRALLLSLFFVALSACSSSDSGSDGSAGSSGSAGTAGSAGSAGTAGTAGSAGSESSDPNRAQTILALSVDVSSGQALFTSKCASCHGSDGKSGSAHRDAAGEASQNPSGALGTILKGEDEMPSFSDLSNQQLADILAYLQSLN